jgi:hypothetical protein
VAIDSGGCNVLSYPVSDPARIAAVDLSRAHVALNRLKLMALIRLPNWESYYRFFGSADEEANVAAYERLIAPHLDLQSRGYWEGRSLQQLGRRRISIFARNACRHGKLGRFIGVVHALCRLWRRSQPAPERPHARGAARVLRLDAGAVVRQARRALGHRQPPIALRPRHSACPVPAAATCAMCCANGSSASPAASASMTTTSPDRRSAAPMPGMARGRSRPICGVSTSTRFGRGPTGSRC